MLADINWFKCFYPVNHLFYLEWSFLFTLIFVSGMKTIYLIQRGEVLWTRFSYGPFSICYFQVEWTLCSWIFIFAPQIPRGEAGGHLILVVRFASASLQNRQTTLSLPSADALPLFKVLISSCGCRVCYWPQAVGVWRPAAEESPAVVIVAAVITSFLLESTSAGREII